jgi:hypothetical protein
VDFYFLKKNLLKSRLRKLLSAKNSIITMNLKDFRRDHDQRNGVRKSGTTYQRHRSAFQRNAGLHESSRMGRKKLKEIGIDMIWKMEAKAPVWIRGKESLQIKTANGDWKNIRMLSFGNSEGTGGKDLTGEIVLINSTSDLNAMSVGQLKDKIVFVNLPMDPKIINTSDSYLITAKSNLFPLLSLLKPGKSINYKIINNGFRRYATCKNGVLRTG